MSRLIDADILELDAEWNEYEDGFMSYSKMQIDNAETVKVIPIEVVEQIKEEIAHSMDMEPAWKGQDNYVGGLEIALAIIDKALKEQNN